MGRGKEQADLLSEKLPYAAMISESTVITKDAVLLLFIEVVPAESEKELSEQRIRDLNQIEKLLGDGWMVWIDATRRPVVTDKETGSWEYRSRFVITVGFSSKGRPRFGAWKFGRGDEIGAGEDSLRGDLWRFERVSEDIVSMFAAVFSDAAMLAGDDVLEYLYGLWDNPDQPVEVPRGMEKPRGTGIPFIDNASRRVVEFFGGQVSAGKRPVGPAYLDVYLGRRGLLQTNTCELLSPGGGREHIHVATVRDFAAIDRPEMIAELMSSDIAVRVVTRIVFAGRAEGAKSVWRERQKRFKNRKGLGRLYSEQVMDDARSGVRGYVDTRLIVRSWDFRAGRRDIEAARKIVNARGFPVKHETVGASEAFLGTLPGDYGSGQELLVTRIGELARFLPLWHQERDRPRVELRSSAEEFDVLV